ncbi:MAG: ATP-binding cassette domain-containing protein [Dehalococcoidia bacterium]|nr:ATP-binding cassette domain-containing protein [Dehalococcoidia bacterium]
MTEAAIRFERVSKRYPGAARPAVTELTLDLPAGAVTALVGPSGCGKTTTLKMINRIVEPTSGRITVDGRDVTSLQAHELRRGIGYVIQEFGLFPHRTVAENIATVPRLLGWSKSRTRDRIAELIEVVGLEAGIVDRYPAALSGGQRQRVGVARALAADPPLLLMDEPFGAVDPLVRARLQDELLALQQRLHKTIVFVTHDIDEAIKLGERVVVLNVGGVVEQEGTPDELLRKPASAFVEDFLGSERGLRRLSLLRAGDVGLEPGPVVAPGDDTEEACRVMDRERLDWVLVVQDERLLGWLGRDELAPGGVVDAGAAHPLQRRIAPEATLREVLDAIVNSPELRVAVVTDGVTYRGVLRLSTLAEELART